MKASNEEFFVYILRSQGWVKAFVDEEGKIIREEPASEPDFEVRYKEEIEKMRLQEEYERRRQERRRQAFIEWLNKKRSEEEV